MPETEHDLRIAALVPAATDLVAALGLGSNLVAVSHECDHPIAAGLPVVTGSHIPAAGVGGDAQAAKVDAAVSQAVVDGQALYTVDTDLLSTLEVDVIVSQTICDVCAVRRDHFSDRLHPGIGFVDLTATSLAGLYADIDALGATLGVADRAEALKQAIQLRITDVARTSRSSNPKRVATIEWSDPPFVGGHWVPEVVELAGGVNSIGDAGAPSRRMNPTEIIESRPDVMLVLPCGFDLDGAVAEAERMLDSTMSELEPGCEVWALDANRLLSRCTPAIATAVETVAAILSGADVDPHSAIRIER